MDFSSGDKAHDLSSSEHEGPKDPSGKIEPSISAPGETESDAAKAEATANAAQSPATGPLDGQVISPGSAQAAGEAGKNAKAVSDAAARSRSSLILVPPVTRNSEGPSTGERFDTKDSGAGNTFTADRMGPPPRGKHSWLRYAAPAALGLCLFGAGIATGGRFFGVAAPANHAASPMPKAVHVAQANSERIEMRRLNKKLSDEIHRLEIRLDSMRVAVQTRTPEELHSLKKGLDNLKASLDAAKTETNASMAQVTARLDRLQRDEAKLQQPVTKASHIEHAATAPLTTSTIARAAPPRPAPARPAEIALATPPALPQGQAQPLGSAPQPKKKLQLLSDWVVRDVYRGVALVEGPAGTIEVTRGESIPGAGKVESIEHGRGGWIVVTNRGIVGSPQD